MTPTTSAVRAACDAVRHGVTGPGEIPYCSWPRCGCELSDAVLDTLLANARAEGAAGERETCANYHDARATYYQRWYEQIREKGSVEDAAVGSCMRTHLSSAAAIRTRARDAKEAT